MVVTLSLWTSRFRRVCKAGGYKSDYLGGWGRKAGIIMPITPDLQSGLSVKLYCGIIISQSNISE